MLRPPFTDEQEMLRDAYRKFLEAELVPYREIPIVMRADWSTKWLIYHGPQNENWLQTGR